MRSRHHPRIRSLCPSRCSYQKTRICLPKTVEIQFKTQLHHQSHKIKPYKGKANFKNLRPQWLLTRKKSRRRIKKNQRLPKNLSSTLRLSKDNYLAAFLDQKQLSMTYQLIKSQQLGLRNKKSWHIRGENPYMLRTTKIILRRKARKKQQKHLMQNVDHQELKDSVRSSLLRQSN